MEKGVGDLSRAIVYEEKYGYAMVKIYGFKDENDRRNFYTFVKNVNMPYPVLECILKHVKTRYEPYVFHRYKPAKNKKIVWVWK